MKLFFQNKEYITRLGMQPFVATVSNDNDPVNRALPAVKPVSMPVKQHQAGMSRQSITR